MNIKRHEFGWLVDGKLTKKEANRVSATIEKEVSNAFVAFPRWCYYTKIANIEIKKMPKKKYVDFLKVEGQTNNFNSRQRQIIFYRNEGDGSFYLEGDVQADMSNQRYFFAGLKELCKIWGCELKDFGYSTIF